MESKGRREAGAYRRVQECAQLWCVHARVAHALHMGVVGTCPQQRDLKLQGATVLCSLLLTGSVPLAQLLSALLGALPSGWGSGESQIKPRHPATPGIQRDSCSGVEGLGPGHPMSVPVSGAALTWVEGRRAGQEGEANTKAGGPSGS